MSYNQDSSSQSSSSLQVIKRAKEWAVSLGEELAVRTGTPDLPIKSLPELSDKMFLKTKELMTIGARTSQGKSSFAAQLAWDWAQQGIPTLYLSLEMTAHSLLERLFSLHCTVPNGELQRGGFSKHSDAWKEFVHTVQSSKLYIAEGHGQTWRDLNDLIERFPNKPRVVVLDYIQCIKGAGLEKREQIDEYIGMFRRMAIEHDFLAICISQINRSAENAKSHEPALHNLKSTGFLEELSDKVVLLHYPSFYDHAISSDQYRIHLAKNRSGRTGVVESVRFIPEFYKFEEGRLLSEKDQGDEIAAVAKQFHASSVREITNWRD